MDNNINQINYYKIYENIDEKLLIMGKIDYCCDINDELNDIFNIDNSYGTIIHIPMLNEIHIDYLDQIYNIKINNLSTNNNFCLYNNDIIKILSIKNVNNIISQDIIIQTNHNMIIIHIYKFIKPFIKSFINLTHGSYIIFRNNIISSSKNNTIYYTKYYNNIITI